MSVVFSIRRFGLKGSSFVLVMIKFTAPDLAEAQEASMNLYWINNNYEVY